MTPNRHILAAALMVLTMALYVANDTLVKLLGEAMPLGQIISLRGAIIIAIVMPAIWLLPGHGPASLRWLADRGVLLRAGLDTLVTFFYLFALLHMPIANVLAIMNLSPLAILPLAARLLGEHLRPAQVLTVLAGLVGAAVVVRPGPEGFNPWAISAFLAMLGVAGRDLVTRTIDTAAPSLVIALANIILVQLAALPLWALSPGPAPSAAQWAMLAAMAGFLGAAYVLIVVVVRMAPVSATSVWRYSIIVWGVLAGWLVFGQWPDGLTFAGIALIAAAAAFASRTATR